MRGTGPDLAAPFSEQIKRIPKSCMPGRGRYFNIADREQGFQRRAIYNHDLNKNKTSCQLNTFTPTSSVSFSLYSDVKDIKKSNNSIRLACLNVNSLRYKIALIKDLIAESSLDILCLSETHLDSCIPDSPFLIPLYHSFRFDKPDSNASHSGGLITYIRSSLNPSFISNQNFGSSIFVTVLKLGTSFFKSLHLLSVYRHPSGSAGDLALFLNFIGKFSSDTVFCGDLNLNLLDKSNTLVKTYKRSLSSHGFSCPISIPTRSTPPPRSTHTLIDHIFHNCKARISSSGVILSSISDHDMPFIIFHNNFKLNETNKPPLSKNPPLIKRNFDKIHINSFLGDVERAFSTQDFSLISDPFPAINNILLPILDKHAPLISQRKPRHSVKPWVTKEFIHLVNLRNYFHHLFMKSNSLEIFQIYKTLRNDATSLSRSLKSEYLNKTFLNNRSNSKKLWQMLSSTVNLPLSPTCDPSSSPDEINHHFNNAAFNCLSDSFGPDYSFSPDVIDSFLQHAPSAPDNHFIIPPITELNLLSLLKSLKNSSTGHDQIPGSILKILSDSPSFFSSLLSALNYCINSSTVPSSLKIARVRPIPKKEDNNDISNMRPISILCNYDKILERHINQNLIKFFNENNLFYPLQAGFRPSHSCSSILSVFTDEIYSAFNSKKVAVGIFLDAKKAFDSIFHKILLKKLSYYGLSSESCSLIDSFLSNRTQFVSSNSVNSSLLSNHSIGVPQGSILGPTLFLIFINDLPFYLSKYKTFLYADDTSLLISGNNLNEVAQSCNNALSDVSFWFSSNRMLLNPSKSKCMLFSTPQRLRSLSIDSFPKIICESDELEFISSFKLLGVTLDPHLTFKPHIDSLVSKIRSNTFFLNLAQKNNLPTFTRKLLYYGLIHSHISYCLQVYSSTSSSSHILDIEKVRKRSARLILDAPFLSHSLPLFNQLNWPTLNQLITASLASDVALSLLDIAPSYIKDRFSSPSHSHSTRFSDNNLAFPLPRTSSFRHSTIYRSIQSWNSLNTKPSLLLSQNGISVASSVMKKRILKLL